MKAMPIPNTAQLIADCWDRAEQALRKSVREKFPDRDEDKITDHFHGELESEFSKASESGKVSRAFQRDLAGAFPRIDATTLQSQLVTARLVATVSFHSPRVEGKTGGDLGIVLLRPDIQQARHGSLELTVNQEYRRGLLCQAKIFRRTSQWGKLSPSEERALADKLDYTALLLYRYADQNGERRELSPFMWQLMAGAAIPQVSQWLSLGEFPSLQSSRQILDALASDQIGTGDKHKIDKEITPPLRPSLIIKIGWKPHGPGGTIRIRQSYRVANQQILQRY
jgi:hypothetical protein